MSIEELYEEIRRRQGVRPPIEQMGYQTPDDLINSVSNAYDPIKRAALARMASRQGVPTDASPLLNAITGQQLTQGEQGPLTWEDVSSQMVENFPEVGGEGRDYGSFVAKMGPDDRVHNYPKGRVAGQLGAPPVARRVNSVIPHDATLDDDTMATRREVAQAKRAAQLESRQQNRANYFQNRREDAQQSRLLTALLSNPELGKEYIRNQGELERSKIEAQPNSDIEQGVKLAKVQAIREAMASGTLPLDEGLAAIDAVMSGADVGDIAGVKSPVDQAAELEQQNATREANQAAIENHPEIAKSTADSLPSTASKDEIEAEGLTAEDLERLSLTAQGTEYAHYNQLYQSLTGRTFEDDVKGLADSALRRREMNRQIAGSAGVPMVVGSGPGIGL